jgi:hypothetical protein
VQIQKLSAQTRSGGFLGRGILSLWQRNSAFLRHNADRLGKPDVFDLAHKRENVARHAAAETVKKLPHRMHGKRWRFFLVKRAQPRVVLRPRLAQADISLDDLDDVGLLLDELSEVTHRRVSIDEDKSRQECSM